VALAVGLITAVGLGVVACSGDEPPRSSARSATPQQAAGPLRAVPLDGAALDVGAKTNPLPDDPSYFPIGVWLASVTDPADIEEDQDAGLNLYVGLTANSDLEMVAESDMKVLAHDEWFDRGDDPGSEAIAGWVLGDEVDMTEGPVRGPRTMQSRLDEVGGDGRLTYANYGKGVMFWETDAEAARFVNEFQDIVSNDIYWFTDPNVCGGSEGGDLLAGGEELDEAECRLAANYGKTVRRMRELVEPAGSKPVWNFVEVGHPFTEEDAPTITAAQARAAVWSSIINGARGIVYFNHSFAGPCVTHHALREPCYEDVRETVTETNRQITELAPVLNSPTVEGVVQTSSAVETMSKVADDGTLHVFAASTSHEPQDAQLVLTCLEDGEATVVGEDRTVDVVGGLLEDEFADGDAVHVYRIDGATGCRVDP
jgi:hypothetical protein